MDTHRHLSSVKGILWLLLMLARSPIAVSIERFDPNAPEIPDDPELHMTATEIIENRGYPAEIHSVVTDDGYILELHRIPYSAHTTLEQEEERLRRGVRRRPVFLQHGVLNTAAVWLLNPTHQSLAFLLVDAGFDVWLGNFRGNPYSRRHTFLNPRKKSFWNFSWDHLGYFDVPACVDYILQVNGHSKLIYVGHSLGTAAFFIAASLMPSLNQRIHLMVALAPISSVAHSTTPTKIASPMVRPLTFLFDRMLTGLVLDSGSILQKMQDITCHKNTHRASFCRDLIFQFIGANPANFNLTRLPLIHGHVLEGTSVKVMAQFAQNYNAGQTFIPYDYGKKGNLKRYGQKRPPPYELNLVTAPVYLYFGRNDIISTPQDVAWLAKQLGNLRGFYEIDDPLFNHWDFLWSANVNELLNYHLIQLLLSHR